MIVCPESKHILFDHLLLIQLEIIQKILNKSSVISSVLFNIKYLALNDINFRKTIVQNFILTLHNNNLFSMFDNLFQ